LSIENRFIFSYEIKTLSNTDGEAPSKLIGATYGAIWFS